MLTDNQQTIAGDAARKAQWFFIHRLPSLAFDHIRIIADAVEKGIPETGKKYFLHLVFCIMKDNTFAGF